DGGGVRGYASLCNLEEVENAIKRKLDTIGQEKLYSEDFKPCDYFNIMCGTSTGGIIAIMLGRLRMSIKSCKDAYKKFAQQVFGTSNFITNFRGVKTLFSRKDNDLCFYRYCPVRLEKAIVRCLEEQGLTADEPLIPAGGFSEGCKV
ncbi:hypothetical protein BDD12DRAFT_733377, partial [Trichophaea hybrida]